MGTTIPPAAIFRAFSWPGTQYVPFEKLNQSTLQSKKKAELFELTTDRDPVTVFSPLVEGWSQIKASQLH